ncbi:DUF2938 domain-containing protein [Pseudoalteromonas sp. C2R02]|uniref:DUF2938 family protein n=1 Tax=Pseudoalteromonas sp. C2R02 TaxID=2841565 RepID=UPI001C07F319|nr:DUF2938 domain-containing protein [Pseudoalteromonas sp. C2R02]
MFGLRFQIKYSNSHLRTGQWLGHIPNEKLTHNAIITSPKIKYENALSWLFHYLIGILYAGFYIALITIYQANDPSVLSAWLFGLATIISPWFIMQPSLGMGICASKAEKPNIVRLQNFVIHSIFGFALYYSWLFLLQI